VLGNYVRTSGTFLVDQDGNPSAGRNFTGPEVFISNISGHSFKGIG